MSIVTYLRGTKSPSLKILVAPLIINFVELFQLWLLSSIVLTVSIKTLIAFFMIGAMLVPFVNLPIQMPAAYFLGNEVNSYTFNPIAEESLKIFPLLLLIKRTQGVWAMGILDIMLVGAALGGGFEFTEDSIRLLATPGASSQTIFGTTEEPWRLNNLPSALITWPPGGWYGVEVSYYQYPDHLLLPNGSAETFSSAHLIWSALLAWGIGMALRLKKKVWWILPIFLGAYTMFDHAAFNYASSKSFFFFGPDIDDLGLIGPIYWLEGLGRLTPILLLGAVLVGLALDIRRLRNGLIREPGLRLSKEGRRIPYFISEAFLLIKSILFRLGQLRNIVAFIMLRRRIINLGLTSPHFKHRHSDQTPEEILRGDISELKRDIELQLSK